MSTRQSRFLLVNGSVHIDVPVRDLPDHPPDQDNTDAAWSAFFNSYVQPTQTFVIEHENRHVHQALAYPALYLRGVREYQWARSALSDFRARGDIAYDPEGKFRTVIDPQEPSAFALRRSYYASVARYHAGCDEAGQFVWGTELETRGLVLRRTFSESKLLEAEALAVHFGVARKRGFVGQFGRWARSQSANTAPIDDLVTVLSLNQERDSVEELLLRFVPALVWHAFHTTWPVTAFMNFLEGFTSTGGFPHLAGMDVDSMFSIVGALRFGKDFMDECPLVTADSLRELVKSQQPLTEPFQQFDYDPGSWRIMFDSEEKYPLREAAVARQQDGSWPEPMEFVDPSPNSFVDLQARYPATAYLIRGEPSGADHPGRGAFRRLIPRSPGRADDAAQWREWLVLLEHAQVLLANVYVQTIPAQAVHGGWIEQTCWHGDCPVHATGLCRFWDAIPARSPDCEFRIHMPRVLSHVVERTPTPLIRKVAAKRPR